jgi:bacterioferritin
LKETGIAEMKHAEKLAERILFLNGEPTSKPDGLAKKKQEITEMLKTDIGLETEAIKMYNEAPSLCGREDRIGCLKL